LRKVIASTTLAAYDAAEQLKAIKWDMLIVDEAHHMLGSPVLLDFVQQLSQAVPSLLLLSAIPAQRREDDFLRLLGLLEPGRYQSDSKEEQEKFRILYAAQSDIGRRLRRLTRRVEALASGESTPDDVIGLARRLLDLPSLEDDAQLGSMIDSLDSSTGTLTEEARSIIHHVADRHRVNRRILRNRRTRLIEEGQLQPIQRKFKPHPYQPEQLEIELTGAVETILRTLQDKRVVAELLIPFTRVITHSTVLPSTAEAFLERLSGAETGKLNSKGLDFLAMGYMFGYEDWEDYADLVCMGIRPFLSDELVERAFESAKTWRRSKRGTARFERLTNFLNSKQQENPLPKLLVFAGFPEATEEVAKLLRIEFGNSAVKEFRHDLSQDEKEQNVRQFQATPKTWILVSDETGGEGRNFQFASELIHFDNPWYASRVEQRIGRLDRLGRERVRNDVVSNVIFSEGSIEDGLVRSYHSGLKVYDESISGLEFALRDVEQRIVEVALEGGYDALVDNVLELGKMAEQERAQDESEAVLDEASFELKAAERFRRVSQSPDGEKELEESFVNYFRTISSPKSAKEWHEPAWPVGVWKFSADNTLVQLPTLNKNQAGLVGEFKGTFRREIAQQRPELGFFNVGNPFFDGVIETLWQQPTARTYAVACTSAQHEGWTGLEFAFYAKPDLKMLEGNYGLANQATSLFTTKPIHLFFTTEGVYDAGGDVLLAIRQQLTKDLKGRTWWNLTKEKAQLPSQSLGGRDWQDTVQDIYKIARDTARQLFAERFGGVIEAETKRIAEQCRQLRQQGDDLSQRDIIPLQVLALSIENWSVELDSLGFLSVNEINVR
jgi:ATP-dependent helicase HepA